MKLKFSRKYLVAAAIAGVVMIAVSVLIPQKTEKTESVSFYSEKLEEKVTELIGCVEGIENVSVMVTLDCTSESVYAENKESSGDRSVSDYVVISSKGGESTVRLKEIYPKVRGVAVVCTGGDSVSVQKKITDILSSSLGIPSNRITVCG